MRSNGPIKRTISALLWLPMGILFTQFFYVAKSIKGTSMQVRLPFFFHDVLIVNAAVS